MNDSVGAQSTIRRFGILSKLCDLTSTMKKCTFQLPQQKYNSCIAVYTDDGYNVMSLADITLTHTALPLNENNKRYLGGCIHRMSNYVIYKSELKYGIIDNIRNAVIYYGDDAANDEYIGTCYDGTTHKLWVVFLTNGILYCADLISHNDEMAISSKTHIFVHGNEGLAISDIFVDDRYGIVIVNPNGLSGVLLCENDKWRIDFSMPYYVFADDNCYIVNHLETCVSIIYSSGSTKHIYTCNENEKIMCILRQYLFLIRRDDAYFLRDIKHNIDVPISQRLLIENGQMFWTTVDFIFRIDIGKREVQQILLCDCTFVAEYDSTKAILYNDIYNIYLILPWTTCKEPTSTPAWKILRIIEAIGQ